MKAIFIVYNLGAGGAERVVSILSKAFADRNIPVDIVMLLTDNVQYEIPASVNLVPMNTLDMSKADRISCLRAYFKAQKKQHRDIVALPFLDGSLRCALAAAAGLGIPVIASERNDPYQKGRGGLKRIGANVPYALANWCVFQTPDARDYYINSVKKRGTVIPNPLTLPEDLYWQGARSRRIVSVGRLEPQKNQKILIEAFARVHREFPDYTLEIYGEGSLRQQLQEQIQGLGLENAVFLRGHTSHVHAELSRAAMFVMPSDYEGMSNALLEALGIGVPVISTDHPIGGARMLIRDGENGLLTPVGDGQALYRAMVRLIREPEQAGAMGQNGQQVRQLLSVDAIAEKWLEVIEKARRC